MNDNYYIMDAFLNKEDIEFVLNDGNNHLHKALISFVFSTGLDNEQIINLKVSDLINAFHNYLNDASEDSIDNLLNLNPSKIFPCWVFDKEPSIRIIYNTPETTEYLLSYLKDKKNYSTINSTDYLFSKYFKNKDKNEGPATQLKKDYINKELSRKNKKLSEIRKKGTFFTKNNLILSFRKICNDNLDVDDSDKEELTNLFFGKATKDNKFYQMYQEDRDSILKYYKQITPYLTIMHTINNNAFFEEDNKNSGDEQDSTQFLSKYFQDKVGKQLDLLNAINGYSYFGVNNNSKNIANTDLDNQQDTQNDKNNYSKEQIDSFVDHYFFNKYPDYTKNELGDLPSQFKHYVHDYPFFKDSSDFLDILFYEWLVIYRVNSIFKENLKIDDSNYETVVTEVTEDLTPILEIYNIEKEDFHQCLLDVVGNLQDDGASFLTSEHIIKVIFSILHKNRGIRTYRFH